MDYYSLLGVNRHASAREIKQAFREKAKRLHPDVAGESLTEEMRLLLTAYQVLSSADRRFEYDRRFAKPASFDYRSFLQHQEDPVYQGKLFSYDLFHHNEDAAITLWQNHGGIDFQWEYFMDREEWMDAAFVLAEELEKRRRYYEAVRLLAGLVREERRRPYFRHFAVEVENRLKELVRRKLKKTVDAEHYIQCLEELLTLGFSSRDEMQWLQAIAETLLVIGKKDAAGAVFKEFCQRFPNRSLPSRLRKQFLNTASQMG